jgi:hypothetical protein
MRLRIAAIVMLGTIACVAAARNVIVEWGAHDPNEYSIDTLGSDDVGVTIYANTQPWLLWKFEAYSGATDEAGYINYIRIADGVTVGDIHLSVIGQLPHLHGAARLDSFNLITNGTSTNRLEQLDVTGDFGAVGALQAPSAGTLHTGGIVRNLIDVGDITGPVTIGRRGADLHCHTMQNLTITGPAPDGYPLPNIVLTGDYLAAYAMNISQAVNRLEIDKLSGDVVVSSLEHLKVYSISEQGSVEVTGDLSHLEVTGQHLADLQRVVRSTAQIMTHIKQAGAPNIRDLCLAHVAVRDRTYA